MVILLEKTKEYYIDKLKTNLNYNIMTKNFLSSFLFGGLISVFGEILRIFYNKVFNFSIDEANILMTITFILVAGILTGIGVFDKISEVLKMAALLPITGFCNSVISSTMDYKNEGLITGVGSNLFKLAGSVIVLGSTCAVIVGGIKYLFSGVV